MTAWLEWLANGAATLLADDCAALMLLAVVLAVALLCALVGLCIHIRLAVLGRSLLDVSGGDYKTAVETVAAAQLANEVFGAAITRGLRRRKRMESGE